MGIFGAMTTAVSGLRTQSYALENISGNIANSQTTGFKRVETSFVDMIPETPKNRGLAGSVSAYSRLTNTIQGDLQPTGISTNMAINGEGYFIVREQKGTNGTRPVFGDRNYYTRRGDFALDRNGHLVNGAGYYLRGESFDPDSGQVRNGGAGVIEISPNPLRASITSNIDYRASLPSMPATREATGTTAGSELLRAALIETNGTVLQSNEDDFLDQTISGGSIIAYNEIGAPVDVQLRWGKAAADTWNLFYMTNSNAAPTEPAWKSVGNTATPLVDMVFTSGGRLDVPGDPWTVPIENLTINNVAVGNVTLRFGETGLTQYPATGGLIQGVAIEQDGFPTGTLDSVSIGNDGLVVGNYSNGRMVPVAQVTVVQFNADNALKRSDGGTYEETFESGPPIMGLGGAQIAGGHVENSNTDIAEEFSKMIITQQAYSANTRVVSTAQQMMQDVINIVR